VDAAGAPPPTTCDFCGKFSTEVGAMAEGRNDVHICVPCLRSSLRSMEPVPHRRSVTCSFCGRKAIDAVEGPSDVYMCPACVEISLKLVVEHDR
jgi:hypothetical protein